jgi:hypothetical protein
MATPMEGSIMQQQYQRLLWVAMGLIVLIGIIGCQSDESSITGPVNPTQLMNFYATDAIGYDYDVYYYTENRYEFEFDVPAGDRLVEYETNLGIFTLVLRANKPATIYIGLQPGDILLAMSDWPGQIIPGSRILVTSGPVEIYSWPPEPIPVDNVFILSPSVSSKIQNQRKLKQNRD